MAVLWAHSDQRSTYCKYGGRIGANVGRAASGAARGAARFVSTPLRVAQRNYAVVGKQAFLTSAGVLQADEGG